MDNCDTNSMYYTCFGQIHSLYDVQQIPTQQPKLPTNILESLGVKPTKKMMDEILYSPLKVVKQDTPLPSLSIDLDCFSCPIECTPEFSPMEPRKLYGSELGKIKNGFELLQGLCKEDEEKFKALATVMFQYAIP